MKRIPTATRNTAVLLIGVFCLALLALFAVGCASDAGESKSADAEAPERTETQATSAETDASEEAVSSSEQGFGKTLVAYFSGTGHTAKVASMIAEATGGELYAIEAAEPYTEAELSSDGYYGDNRPYNESQDQTIRPELASAPVADAASYQTVFLGYPNWYGKAPTIIYSFLDANDFASATLYPFCTSGSSSITESQTVLDEFYPDLNWMPGERFSPSATQEEVDAWLKTLTPSATTD